MILSRYNLKNISSDAIDLPGEEIFSLPEKVLQFGTGVLLRGLPDYFIDKANRQGIFNGRIVVVKSTAQGTTQDFEKQDGLYTICVRGLKNGERIEENIVNASISRVLNAPTEWEEVLTCAHNRQMQVIISNTTEMGISFVQDDIRHHPPKSFPGKLLAFLYERYKAFEGSAHSGMVIVPTELIPDNGKQLESIVLELAHLNGLEDKFIEWLENHNHFCNSLVDRIVPGKPDQAFLTRIEEELGYKDHLLSTAEYYRLWAIEGDEHVKNVLSFASVDEGVIIESNIDRYRELKLRMLNGTHTLGCAVALLSGCKTVLNAMEDEMISTYLSQLMLQEIAPAIPYPVDAAEAAKFGEQVLDRFRNPHINHLWESISVNYSSKMKMRCVPLLVKHYEDHENVPKCFALGFAAYLYFMKAVARVDGKYSGEYNGTRYPIQDELAEVFYKRWTALSTTALVTEVLRDNAFWGADLHALPGFKQAVINNLNLIMNNGMKEAIEELLLKKVAAA